MTQDIQSIVLLSSCPSCVPVGTDVGAPYGLAYSENLPICFRSCHVSFLIFAGFAEKDTSHGAVTGGHASADATHPPMSHKLQPAAHTQSARINHILVLSSTIKMAFALANSRFVSAGRFTCGRPRSTLRLARRSLIARADKSLADKVDEAAKVAFVAEALTDYGIEALLCCSLWAITNPSVIMCIGQGTAVLLLLLSVAWILAGGLAPLERVGVGIGSGPGHLYGMLLPVLNNYAATALAQGLVEETKKSSGLDEAKLGQQPGNKPAATGEASGIVA